MTIAGRRAGSKHVAPGEFGIAPASARTGGATARLGYDTAVSGLLTAHQAIRCPCQAFAARRRARAKSCTPIATAIDTKQIAAITA